MRDRTKYIRLCRALICLNLCFIWGNSLLPGAVSQTISDFVQQILGGEPAQTGNSLFSMLVRKAAHFSEFAVLGLLLRWRMHLTGKNGKWALALGILAACMDETIQLFVPGRASRLLDVGIDTCGVAAGIAIWKIGHYFIRRIKN